eukprot:TRINITY_DN60464_c0_g1_i1.p1 TRINITY_DN60464_c0_g1~~TRINITY_DN60464_c0_g1_i1.p1  ORF type:complete len:197 (+),score=13.53 TRINITY_DN60464_c0_g1_i1:26-592(+)
MEVQTSTSLLEEVLKGKVDESHGINHALAVLGHAQKAIAEESDLSADDRLAVLLAALLHDSDDQKFFPSHTGNENARAILATALANHTNQQQLCETVTQMINMVSCSKNKDSVPDGIPKWYLIPRFSDRLEAVGAIGVVRCYQYTIHKQRPLFLESTSKATNFQELQQIATPERYQQYTGRPIRCRLL